MEQGKNTRRPPSEILVTYGNIHRGFEYPLIKFVHHYRRRHVWYGKEEKRRKKRQLSGKSHSKLSELAVGDYVVHEEHGLGIYKGIEKK